MDETREALFDFVRDLIYDLHAARLDVEALEPDFRQLGKGLLFLAETLRQHGAYVKALAAGELGVEVAGNDINAPLKTLQANLRHLTWQTQQVAKGDYHQRVEFLGEFSDAFNAMVEKLEGQRASLEREINVSHRKTRALRRDNLLLTNITARIPEPIIVLRKDTRKALYQNRAAAAAVKANPALLESLAALVSEEDTEHAGDHHELTFPGENGQARYYSAVTYAIDWEGFSAQAFLVNDISEDKEHMLELEHVAYLDPLTGLHNRFFAMRALNEWMAERKQFALCFVDLDFLKYINDTFGHGEGDKYLLYAAQLLENFDREAVACRVGGDEFLLLAPDYTYYSASSRFVALRREMADYNHAQMRPFNYSMSVGIVEIPMDNRMTASDALSLADERMYDHKRACKKARADVRDAKDDRMPPDGALENMTEMSD